MHRKPTKFALVSHILPPSPSGQAMVLRQLLSRIEPERYCLLSRHDYRRPAGAGAAPNFHWLRRSPHLPELGPQAVASRIAALNAKVGISVRAAQIEQAVRSEGCGLMVACSGDLYDIPAAAVAARRLGIPFIPYLFDDYLYQWTGYRRVLAACYERDAMQGALTAIVPNEFLKREYRSRYGLECAVVRNPCLLPELHQLDRAGGEFGPGESAIVYTGAVYHAHYDAFRNLIAAMEALGRPELRLHIYTAQSGAELQAHGIGGPRVVHHPHVDLQEVPKILRQAAVLFLPLAFDTAIPEVIKTSAPGKTAEYMAVARPILVHAPSDCFVSWYFREYGCGAVAGENDVNVLAAELRRLLDDPAERERMAGAARRAAEQDFLLDAVSRAFAEVIDQEQVPR